MWFLYSKIQVLPVCPSAVFWLQLEMALKKKKRKISRQNQSGSSARLHHLPAYHSRLSKGIFETAKGLLMNRVFIDLWTKQSLIMCRAAFNWGSRTSPLLAERLRGQEWRAFDCVLRHRDEGWGTITQLRHCTVFTPTCAVLYFFRPLWSPPCVSAIQVRKQFKKWTNKIPQNRHC